jgi:hypothetical protein
MSKRQVPLVSDDCCMQFVPSVGEQPYFLFDTVATKSRVKSLSWDNDILINVP